MSTDPWRRGRGAAVRSLAVLAFTALPAAALPQLADPLPPDNPAPLVYCPPERLAAGRPHARHVLNVFLPEGSAPAAGWPVVVATGYGGGASVPPASALQSTGASAPLWNLVRAGIAVVHFGTPGIGGGRGLWYPDGHPRTESWRPADDNPEKSAEWVVQWVKVQGLYPFDLERIGLRGSSGGAVLAIRTAMGPERAHPTGSAQVRASTRVAAILAIQPPTSAWALGQGPELTIPFPGHLEQAAAPGVAATVLSQVDPELQKDYSLMRVAFEGAEARANNAAQPLCLVYGDPVLRVDGAVATFGLDVEGFPLLHDAILPPRQHDSWFGYVFWRRLLDLSPESAAFHRAQSMFAIRDVSALPPPHAWHTRTFRGGVMGPAANRLGHDWLVAQLLGAVPLQASRPRWPTVVDPGPRVARFERGASRSVRWTLEAPGAESWLLLESRPGVPLGALLAPTGATADGGGVRWVLELPEGPGRLMARLVARERAGGLRVGPATWLVPPGGAR